MAVYSTIEGDMLDAICYRVYGRESALVAVLEANPRLAALGPILPAGVLITLPAIPAPPDVPTVRLWD